MLKDNDIFNFRLAAPTAKLVSNKHYTNEYTSTVHRMLGAKGLIYLILTKTIN